MLSIEKFHVTPRTFALTLFLVACGSGTQAPSSPEPKTGSSPAAPAPSSAPVSPEDPVALLHRMRAVSGMERWDAVRALHAKGDAVFDGVKGTFTLDEDLAKGRFALRAKHEAFVVGEGFDGTQRWRQDASGQPHPLDTDEAKAITISEVYLARRGYLFPDAIKARFRRLPTATEDGRAWEKLEVTPEGGRTITLRIDPKSYYVDRATMHLSFYPRVIQYGDYRPVNGTAILPFSIATTNEETLTVTSYRIESDGPRDSDYAAPSRTVGDLHMTGPKTTATMHLDPGGRFLLDAKIDGQGPFPFIFDTGGHSIVTPEVAAKLGMKGVGSGVTFGAGEGSTPTQYAKVGSLRVGDAELVDHGFMIMPLPYSVTDRGKKTPIAGILGLEVFDRLIVHIDYDRNVITFTSFDAPAATPAGTAVPFQFTLDMPMARAKLDGHEGIFGLDTGNSGDVVVFRDWAVSSGLADRYRAGVPLVSFGAGGESVNYLARAQSFDLGGQNVTNLLARLAEDKGGAFAAVGEAGNIGQPVFSRFNITFDYRKQLMYLEPRKAPKIWPPTRGGFGAVKTGPGAFKIVNVVKGGPAAEAGLKPGDTFVAIDGVPAERLAGDDLFQKVRQAPGTKVRLAMQRDGKREDRSITLRELVR